MKIPKVIRNERVIVCDVDDTLIMHAPLEAGIAVTAVLDPVTNHHVEYMMNVPVIRLVKEEAARGSTIIVWSRGGFQWAENVVKAVDLEHVVDLIMTKPLTYFDDKPVQEWLTDRVYLPYNVPYKKNML